MTEKLFYQDSYQSAFEALVLSCTCGEQGYQAVLSRTAFFPEGGGQTSDTGVLLAGEEEIKVVDVQEEDGVVVHYVDRELKEGTQVKGKLDFEERFSKMQQHTGEHIVSGIVHRRFGYKNVGFHLGKEGVTMDYDGILSPEELKEIEYEANRAVAADIPLVVLYPSEEELGKIFYRSKIEIEGQVRIVQIPGYDSCACCAPHVKSTGSVGLIKLTGAIHYKGGMRVSMLCGFRALGDYNQKETSVIKLSNLLSAKQELVVQAAERLLEEIRELKEKKNRLQAHYLAACLEMEKRKLSKNPAGNLLLFAEELDGIAMRNIVNQGMYATEGFCGVFAGSSEGYTYVLGSKTQDIREAGKRLNRQFGGKGGGKPPMIQGSLQGEEEEIRSFLDTLLE